MYLQFFGLKQEPFSIAPDPHYLFMSKRHREALAHLLYGLKGGGGFVLLTGEIGAGKTTVCRCLLEQVPKRCNVAYIFNPKLTVNELLRTVCDEFGIGYPVAGAVPATVKDYLDPLNAFLLQTHAVGQKNLLIIDEAQALSADVLEQLRLLTNLETNERKLLQIVLIGQPELRTLLARPELEQLAQRVIARFHLDALSALETRRYIRHRLAVAGMTQEIPFDSTALVRIHTLARGIPRRINLLCDRAMLGAYARGNRAIDAKKIDEAAREVFEEEVTGWRRFVPRRLLRFGVGAAVLAVGLAAYAGYLFMIDRDASRLRLEGIVSRGPAVAAELVGSAAEAAAAVGQTINSTPATTPRPEVMASAQTVSQGDRRTAAPPLPRRSRPAAATAASAGRPGLP